MRKKQIFAYDEALKDFNFTKEREFRKMVLIGKVLLSLHQKQGTQGYLFEAIEPYLEKKDRALFGLV